MHQSAPPTARRGGVHGGDLSTVAWAALHPTPGPANPPRAAADPGRPHLGRTARPGRRAATCPARRSADTGRPGPDGPRRPRRARRHPARHRRRPLRPRRTPPGRALAGTLSRVETPQRAHRTARELAAPGGASPCPSSPAARTPPPRHPHARARRMPARSSAPCPPAPPAPPRRPRRAALRALSGPSGPPTTAPRSPSSLPQRGSDSSPAPEAGRRCSTSSACTRSATRSGGAGWRRASRRHRAGTLAQAARRCADHWLRLAHELESCRCP
ncbi:hypothetical protein SGRIM128S_08721 [Streptomyces griseomycini]